MTANKLRIPSYIGGKLKGVTIDLIGGSDYDIFFRMYNGLFYLYQGKRFPLLIGSDSKIGNGIHYTYTMVYPTEFIPTADVILEFDSTGMYNTDVSIKLMWEV